MSRVLPILFNTDMVRAILDGRKTATRRIIKIPRYIKKQEDGLYTLFADGYVYENQYFKEIMNYLNTPYQPDDIIYVRETWGKGYEDDYIYKADDKLAELQSFKQSSKLIYCPSIHMPKEAARIWLKVTDVRVERLQDITEEQAYAEGMPDDLSYTAVKRFSNFWDFTIKKQDLDRYGWAANPWVWVIEFERCGKPEETQ